MTGFGLFHTRRPLMEMVTGLELAEWPYWMKSALEAARLAPCAINRQPWRFRVAPNSIIVSVDSPSFDFGIAMLQVEVAALDSFVKVRWRFLEDPNVARFMVER